MKLTSVRLALLTLAFVGCAEPVEDIDRTQGNLIRKSDLEGEWYMLQTVVAVPPTTGFTFEGETSVMERVRWEITEDYLVAYRSYPRLRGADAPSTGVAFDGKENPLARYRISAHVDVRRDYNPSTGEQTNVIIEDQSDRLWHERTYVRVDWSQSDVQNFEFAAPTTRVTTAAYFVQEEQGGPDAFYREVDGDGVTQYFDVLGKLSVEPDLYGCIYTWYGFSAEDCTEAEIGVRTSFARVTAEADDYEAFHYDDQLMSRFGYFRTEYFTYDEQRGVTDRGRRYLINRHDIWKRSKDDEGKVIPVPERELRAVPYYLSPEFPDDPLLREAAVATMAQWNRAIKKGLRSIYGEVEQDIFVICHNPVTKGDHEACGAEGFSPRMGDLRYSTLHWIDTETLEGLLGYGPSAADPLTGEIVSGKAYVYGAAISTWASYAVDVIRYFNEEVDFDALVHGSHYFEEVEARLKGRDRVARPDPQLDRMGLERPVQRTGRPARPKVRREELRPYDPDTVQRRLDAARQAGHSPMILHDEVKRALAGAYGADWDALPEDVRQRLDPTRVLSPVVLKRQMAHRKAARARGVDFHDLVAPDLATLTRKYAGRTDYDDMWRELRAEIFASTAEHEVGHTLGLRHNFQGSYDSLNYGDDYWALREENLQPAESLGDIYRLSSLTEAQIEGGMRGKQYSSIMDYGYSWQNDISGLRNYDMAAIVFGYTAGSYKATGERCRRYPSVADGDGCLAQQPGLVQVFKKRKNALGRAGEILDGEELGYTYDDPGLPSITALERYHYTTIAQAFPKLEDLLDGGREWMSYAEYLEQKDRDDRAVRVPYLFCSDEWIEGLLSCHAFDQGADPFELTRSKIDDYRAYYPFVNFRRDRPWFDVWDPLFRYFYYTFLPISDYFQSWYIAPYGFDPLFDRTYDLAINSGFNLLAEVLATPSYGTWCEGPDGTLVNISEEITLQGLTGNESECAEDGRQVRIQRGQGRRRYSVYDPQAGYNFPYKPQESGHYWTALAAIWALTDPDAYVLGAEGDAGTYAIGFYDWFDSEFMALSNALLTRDFSVFAPRAVTASAPRGQTREAALVYPKLAPLYDFDTRNLYDPETGERLVEAFGGTDWAPLVEAEPRFDVSTDILWWGFIFTTSSYSTWFNDQLNVFRPGTSSQVEADGVENERVDFVHPITGVRYAAVQPRCVAGGSVGLCGTCEADEECAGHTGGLGGTYCQPIGDDEDTFYCLQDCTNDPSACGSGEKCDDRGNCVPVNEQCVAAACSPRNPLGSCAEGETCYRGECQPASGALSAHCRFQRDGDNGAVQLVLRAQGLTDRYQDALDAWYSYTGPDQALDNRLARAYYRARYELTNHVDLLETVIATYAIFGRIY